MKKQKILIIAVVVLVVLNIATLSFLWFFKPHFKEARYARKPPEVERFLTRRLDLSKEQAEAFRTAREKHFEQTHHILRSLHSDRKQLSQLLGQEDSTQQHELLTRISVKRAKIERLNFGHLKNLRALCTDDQKQRFDTVIIKMIDSGFGVRGRRKKRIKRNK